MRSRRFAFLVILLCTSAAARAFAAASLTPLGINSVANGVSGDGSVVVGTSGGYGGQAFRWTAADGMQGVGDLPGGAFQSGASGVSADGSVIVGYGTSANGYEAFRWTSTGGMVGLGVLPGDLYSAAHRVSADGSVIVGTSGSGCTVGGCVAQVFRWTSADGMVGLGNLPGGFYPWGFSADGSVVVGYEIQYDVSLSPHYTALYWTADGGMRALWDVLLSHGVDPAADGWSKLEFAKAISADGNTIVGDGVRNGNTEAFVAVIPTVSEPASATLMVFGGALLLRRR
jgi:probable HAF family extracellular repeat protein